MSRRSGARPRGQTGVLISTVGFAEAKVIIKRRKVRINFVLIIIIIIIIHVIRVIIMLRLMSMHVALMKRSLSALGSFGERRRIRLSLFGVCLLLECLHASRAHAHTHVPVACD